MERETLQRESLCHAVTSVEGVVASMTRTALRFIGIMG
jgi:hypothetical protein